MLNSLKGTITSAQEQRLLVDCGAWTITLQVPDAGLFKAGSQGEIYTHLHWNQEQGPSLFGFKSELERTVFLLITSCSGLGPKIALAVLAHMGVGPFIDAISRGDEQALSKVSGIGAKKAEQMVVQLKHKVAALVKSGVDLGSTAQEAEQWNNISQVLDSLHYTRPEISRAMKHLTDMYAGAPAIPFDQLMRQALSFLSKKA
jgi:Holliday junction DNA helicase RuvA